MILKFLVIKGVGTLLHVLYVCYSFHQKSSKHGTYTTQGLKNNFYFRSFSTSSGPELRIKDEYRQIFFYLLTKFQKLHSPKELKYLMGNFSKVRLHQNQQLLRKRFLYKFKYSDRPLLLNMNNIVDVKRRSGIHKSRKPEPSQSLESTSAIRGTFKQIPHFMNDTSSI
jgi:hypothetical protein